MSSATCASTGAVVGRLSLAGFLAMSSLLVWAALLQAQTNVAFSAVASINLTVGVWAHWVQWQHAETTDRIVDAPHGADQIAVATRTVAIFLIFGRIVVEVT